MAGVKIRAFLYDLGRNQQPTEAYLRRFLDRLAASGFNMFIINLEHRFEFPSLPGLAPPGSLTADTANRLVEYGRSLNVEVVAQPNFAGHCEGWGATERMSHLTADPWYQPPWGGSEQLNLDLPEARELVLRMLGDVCDAFPGTYLHIGCDEIRRLDYLYPGDDEAVTDALARQLLFLIRAAQERRRTVLIWGDVPLRYPALMAQLPREVIICDWHYLPAGSRETLERYRNAGFQVLACPTIATCTTFATNPEVTIPNLQRMIGDARQLELTGTMVTTWEFGFGSGQDLVWPWVALAGRLCQQEVPDAWALIEDWVSHRYGVSGPAYHGLCDALNRQLADAFGPSLPVLDIRNLRKLLFRGAPPPAELPRRPRGRQAAPFSARPVIWEPSPFQVWLHVRALLDADTLARLSTVAASVNAALAQLTGSGPHQEELSPLLGLGRAFQVLLHRLELLQRCKHRYHEAALLQHSQPDAFRREMQQVAVDLASLEPGLDQLAHHVGELAAVSGLDAAELHWIEVQRASLHSHVQGLRNMDPAGDAVLEFGEFLRRPVAIWPRLAWR